MLSPDIACHNKRHTFSRVTSMRKARAFHLGLHRLASCLAWPLPSFVCSSSPLSSTMSGLRRLAQTNNNASASPRPVKSVSNSSVPSPSTPIRNGSAAPSTPRTRIVYANSPVTSPSLSASLPFDWEAVRSNAPPPYSTPTNKRVRDLRKSQVGVAPGTPTRQRVVRKKSLAER